MRRPLPLSLGGRRRPPPRPTGQRHPPHPPPCPQSRGGPGVCWRGGRRAHGGDDSVVSGDSGACVDLFFVLGRSAPITMNRIDAYHPSIHTPAPVFSLSNIRTYAPPMHAYINTSTDPGPPDAPRRRAAPRPDPACPRARADSGVRCLKKGEWVGGWVMGMGRKKVQIIKVEPKKRKQRRARLDPWEPFVHSSFFCSTPRQM